MMKKYSPVALLLIAFMLVGCGNDITQQVAEDNPQKFLSDQSIQEQETKTVPLATDSISVKQLEKHVKLLTDIGPRYSWKDGFYEYDLHTPEAQTRKLAYLEAEMKSYGYQVKREEFEYWGLQGINLIAERKGKSKPNEVIEVGAHYDTINGPGADDNISGVAGVLEMARVISHQQPEVTVRFLFYDLEEVGLAGSRHHVNQVLHESQETFLGVYVFEMIGYYTEEPNSQESPVRIPKIFDPPRVGDFIAVVGNTRSSALVDLYQKAIKTHEIDLKSFGVKRMGDVLVDAMRSDHAPYWRAKKMAVMLTDTANFRNKNYHLSSDTPDTLNYEFMAKIVTATYKTVMDMK